MMPKTTGLSGMKRLVCVSWLLVMGTRFVVVVASEYRMGRLRTDCIYTFCWVQRGEYLGVSRAVLSGRMLEIVLEHLHFVETQGEVGGPLVWLHDGQGSRLLP